VASCFKMLNVERSQPSYFEVRRVWGTVNSSNNRNNRRSLVIGLASTSTASQVSGFLSGLHMAALSHRLPGAHRPLGGTRWGAARRQLEYQAKKLVVRVASLRGRASA